MGIMVSGIVLIYSSYALFSINQISKSVITIKVGEMTPTVKVDGVTTNRLTIPAGETKTFTVTLENLNGISGKFLFYYTTTLASGVNFGYTTGTGIQIPPGMGRSECEHRRTDRLRRTASCAFPVRRSFP